MDRIDTFNSVISALPMPALIIGRTQRVLSMNVLACELLGHDGSGSHYTTVLRQPGPIEAIEATLADNKRRDAIHTGQEGERDIRYRLDISPLAGGVADGLLIVIEDVSRAEGLGQMRRDFVANVSHELRTPLTALIGFIETLRGSARHDPKAAENFLGMMEVEASRMNRLVHDLLSLSRLESEARVRLDAQIDVVEVVRDTAEVFEAGKREEDGEVTFTLPDEPVWVMGDRDQLIQVLRNLVENAIKYGGGGQVDVSMTLPEREPALRGPAAIIDIRDNGEGIEAHHLPRLTERFYRVDTHRSRAEGGTGLGLAIVKHIVARHRGRLRISSVPGEGSTFTVVLPRMQKLTQSRL